MADAAVSNESKEQKTRGKTVRQSNITAARAIADAVRTSLGPKGMDKMVRLPDPSAELARPAA